MAQDAHACRVKLGLAVVFSNNKCKWEMKDELDRYLAKLAHVSAACRLSEEEERNALHQCSAASGMIKNRLLYLNAVRNGESTVTLKGDCPKVGGQPWHKLCGMGYEYLLNNVSVTTILQWSFSCTKTELCRCVWLCRGQLQAVYSTAALVSQSQSQITTSTRLVAHHQGG
jgi:hypothetical protein